MSTILLALVLFTRTSSTGALDISGFRKVWSFLQFRLPSEVSKRLQYITCVVEMFDKALLKILYIVVVLFQGDDHCGCMLFSVQNVEGSLLSTWYILFLVTRSSCYL